MTLYIGVMSGTSLDGLDIALIELTPAINLIATHYTPMPDSLRAELLGLCASGPDEIARSAIAQQNWVKLAAQGINASPPPTQPETRRHSCDWQPRPDHSPRTGAWLHGTDRQPGPADRVDRHHRGQRLPQP